MPKQPTAADAPASFAFTRAQALALPPIFLCAALYLDAILFSALRIPFDLSYGDNGLMLNEAVRILQGQVIYRDFFDLHLPGGPYFYAALIRLFGARAWLPNASFACLGLVFLGTSIAISRRLLDGAAAFLPGLMFLVVSIHSYLDPTDHWYSVLLIMIAVAALAETSSPTRLIVAGALCGLATIFTQNHGCVGALGFAAFIWWEARGKNSSAPETIASEALFLLPFAATVALCIGYFVWIAGAGNFFASTVTFPFKYWAATSDPNSWSDYALFIVIDQLRRGGIHILRPLIIVAVIPAVYALPLIGGLRKARNPPDRDSRLVVLLCAVGLALFVSIVNSASLSRLSVVALPGFILLIWLVNRSAWTRPALPLFWLLIAALMLMDTWGAHEHAANHVDTPSGTVAIDYPRGNYRDYYQWLENNTVPGEFVFDAAPIHTGLYFLFALRNPTKLWWLTSCDFTTPRQAAEALHALERHNVRFVFWSPAIDHMGCPAGSDHIEPIQAFVRKNYQHIRDFDYDESNTIAVWARSTDHGRRNNEKETVSAKSARSILTMAAGSAANGGRATAK